MKKYSEDMTGIEIFFCGGFLVIAIFCLLLLTGIIKPVSQRKPSEDKDEKESPKEEAASDNAHVVAPSKFNVDEFMAQISSEVISDVRKELPKILKDAIGEVKISDIKFEEGFDEDEEFVPRKFKALNNDETDDAFNIDLRNIDDTPPSEPIATGTSMDELEEAMDVAMGNPVALLARAEERDVLGLISMITIRSDTGSCANCTLVPPMTPIDSTMACACFSRRS